MAKAIKLHWVLLALIFAFDSELIRVFLGDPINDIIKIIGTLFIYLYAAKNRNSRYKLDYILLTICLLVVYVLLISILQSGLSGLIGSIKFVWRFSLIFLIFFLITPSIANQIARVVSGVGLILSIQSLLLFLLVIFHLEPSYNLVARYSDTDLFKSYGVLGFLNVNTGWSLRLQSFFSEPTNFAKFLILPLYYYVWKWRSLKVLKYGIYSLIVGTAILFTFSVTAVISIFVSSVLMLYYRSKQFSLTRIALIFMLGFSLSNAHTLFSSDVDKTRTDLLMSSFQRDDASSSIRKEFIDEVINIIEVNWYGVGFVTDNFIGGLLPLAPTRWLLYGGYIGLVLMVILHIIIFWKGRIDAGKINIGIFFIVGLCQFLISLIHGSWFELNYWLLMGLMIPKNTISYEINN